MRVSGSGVVVAVLVSLTDLDNAARHEVDAARSGARLAALQGATLTPLVRMLDELAADGCPQARLVAVTTAARETGPSWVRRVAGHWVRSSAATRQAAMRVQTAVGAQARLDPPTLTRLQWRDVTGDEAPLHSPAWSEPPPHDRHVLLCRGPRCNARGADVVAQALTEQLRRAKRLDDGVLLTQTSCLFPCNRAPVVVVHPDGEWLGPVHPEDVPDLAQRLL